MNSVMSCAEVLRELSNYIDGVVSPTLHHKIDSHLQACESCSTMLESTRAVVQALSDDSLLDVPPGYSERLYHKLNAQLEGFGTGMTMSERRIPLGITAGQVELGSHLIHFWENDNEFARGVRFLEPGLAGDDHCVVFGNNLVTDRVFRRLGASGFDVTSLLSQRRITLLRRETSAGTTLTDIEDIFEAAVRAGAPAIRYLGNLDYGKVPLPGSGIDDVLELEAKVTSLARRFPAVVVCMYDVNTLPGKLILKGGFQTHPWAVCGDHLQSNPYYVPEAQFLHQLHAAQ